MTLNMDSLASLGSAIGGIATGVSNVITAVKPPPSSGNTGIGGFVASGGNTGVANSPSWLDSFMSGLNAGTGQKNTSSNGESNSTMMYLVLAALAVFAFMFMGKKK